MYLIFCTFAVMKHLILILSVTVMLCGTYILTSCSDTLDPPIDPVVQQRTVIVYMAAENSLSSYSTYLHKTYVQADLDELKSASASIPQNTQIIVYVDDLTLPRIYHIDSNGMTVWKQYQQEHNSVDSLVMLNTLTTIVQNFPAQNYGLVLWSHASNWKTGQHRAFGVDNGNNSTTDVPESLETPTLAAILEQLPRMDYVFFDACYMQSLETAVELAKTDWIIASPTEIPGTGAPYDVITPALCNADIRGIISGYAGAYPLSQGPLLSAVQCSQVRALAQATATWLAPYLRGEQEPSLDGVQIYAPTEQSSIPVPYDLRSLAFHLLPSDQYQEWELSWENAVRYPYYTQTWATKYYWTTEHSTMHDANHYGGISISIPDNRWQQKGWDITFRQLKWYQQYIR